MDHPLIIYFEQTGGFTGMTVCLMLNDEHLSGDEYQQIHVLIEQADFFELQTDIPGNPLPDQLLYRITVETSTRRNTISIYENQVTDKLQPLIRFLSGKARKR